MIGIERKEIGVRFQFRTGRVEETVQISRHTRLILGGIRATAIETFEGRPLSSLPRLTIAETERPLPH